MNRIESWVHHVLRLCLGSLLTALCSTVVPTSAWALDSNTGQTREILFPSATDSDLFYFAANSNSVSLYNYVHDNFEYALYHGSHGGSLATFRAQRGNDVDQAAALIAMLRAAGTPARYVVGTVSLPSSQVMNWLKVENANRAVALMQAAGIQGATISSDSSTIQFEHVWVEAFVAYVGQHGDYRGNELNFECQANPDLPQPQATCHWISLDPSFKQHGNVTSTLDPYTALSFDYNAYYGAIANQATDSSRLNKNPVEIYQEQILSWLNTNYPGKTLADIPDFQDIVAQGSDLLPASLPYQVIGTPRTYNSVADHDSAVPAVEGKKWAKTVTVKVTYAATKISDGQTYTISTTTGGSTGSLISSDVAYQSLTLSPEKDTSGNPNLVARLGGTEVYRPIQVQSGYAAPTMGMPFTVEIIRDAEPGYQSGIADKQLDTGAYNYGVLGGNYTLLLGNETLNWTQVNLYAQNLLSAITQYPIVFNPNDPGTTVVQNGQTTVLACDHTTHLNCTPYLDDGTGTWSSSSTKLSDSPAAMNALTGGLLTLAGYEYCTKVKDSRDTLDGLNKTLSPIEGCVGMVSSTYGNVEYVDGTAFSILPGGLLIDMRSVFYNSTERINQPPGVLDNAQFKLLVHAASSLEHEIWQELTGYDAISTVRGIQIAQANGATMQNLVKNSSTDTMATAYTSLFGFSAGAPSAFTLNERTIYSQKIASWSNASSDGSQSFVALEKVPTSSTDPHDAPLTYTNDGIDAKLACFASNQTSLQNSANANGANATKPTAGTLCISSYPANSTWQSLINLNTQDFNNYRNNTGGASSAAIASKLTYLNETSNAFAPTNFLYRTTAIANDAIPSVAIAGWRDGLYLNDLTKQWVEYWTPSKLAVGSTYKFAVDFRYVHSATISGNPVSDIGAEIKNEYGIAAGGGYVSGAIPITPSTSPTVGTSTSITPTFNNATLNDTNTTSETQNNIVKTPAVASPTNSAAGADRVSVVTGNQFRDETDLVIKGRGINFALTRTYNSTPASLKRNGPFGYGWAFSYGMSLTSNDYGACPDCSKTQAPENGDTKTSSITYTDERGGDHTYLVSATGVVTSPQGEYETLALDTPAAGQATLTFRNGTKYIFETIGSASIKTTPGVKARLKQITDPWSVQNQLNLTYDSTTGRLLTVKDNLPASLGRTGLTFTYYSGSGSGYLLAVTDWANREMDYTVDASGNLVSVSLLDNTLSTSLGNHTYSYLANTHQLQEVDQTKFSTDPTQPDTNLQDSYLTYYPNGRTATVYRPWVQTSSSAYDLFRNTTVVTDARGYATQYEYDASGRQVKEVEPDGGVLFFKNSPDGLRYSKTDGLGYATQYSYRTDHTFNSVTDTSGNVTYEQDPLGKTVSTTYGIYDQVASVTDKRGTTRTTSFHTSTDGTCKLTGKPDTVTLSGLTDSSGTTTSNVKLISYCWNSDGTPASVTEYMDPSNTTHTRVSTYTYTDANHLNVDHVTIKGWDNTTITRSFTYDSLSRVKTESLQRRKSPTDASLITLTTSYNYDARDRVVMLTDASGNQMESQYNELGQLYGVVGHYVQPDASVVDRQISSRAFYDPLPLLSGDTDIYGNSTLYSYDGAGNLIQFTDREGHITTYEYDGMNRRTATVDPNRVRTTVAYDLAGNVKSRTDGNGQISTYQYDKLGHLTQVTDAKGYISQFQYDANGNQTCVIDANAQAGLQPKNSSGCTEFRVFDELNRVIKVVDALGNTTKKSYDLLGNVTVITDAAATPKTTTFAFDGLGRLAQVTDPLSKLTKYSTDEAGNVWQVTNRLNQITQTTFDVLNRPTAVSYVTDGTSESLSYDSFGNLHTVSNSTVSYTFTYDDKNRLLSKLDSRAGKSLSFTYDKADNILTKTDYQGDVTEYKYDSASKLVGLKNAAYLEARYQYDKAGNLLTRTLSNGAQTQFGYDANNWMSSLKTLTANGTALSSATYTRDRVGHITGQTDLAGATTGASSYVFDADYQLKSATYPVTSFNESYVYDAVGNRSTQTLNGATHAYEYYANSNRIKAIHTGTLSGAVERSFSYDDEGRLISQTGSTISSLVWDQKSRLKTASNGTSTWSYLYDPMDYRVGCRSCTNGSLDYYLEGEHLEASYSAGALQNKYFRGSSTDELLVGYSYLTTGRLDPIIFHHDGLMSVVGQSTADGQNVQMTHYSAFGSQIATTNGSATSPNRLLYTGREKDTETGLYYYRRRYVDLSIGGFLSEDPLGFAAGINNRIYVRNDPTDANDPSGERDVTAGEQGFLQPIFGQPNPKFYTSIDIQNGAGGNPIAWVALNVMGRPAITLGNTIHVGGNYYQDDYSANGVSINSQALIAHETTHVFQNQQNGIVGTAAGSVIDNATKGDNAYYYALSPGVGQAGPPKPFALYGVEQQAAVVQDYYNITHGAPSQLNVSPVSSNSDALSSYQATLGTAGLAMPAITGGGAGAAEGGFLIYPNKPNNNSMAVVYKK